MLAHPVHQYGSMGEGRSGGSDEGTRSAQAELLDALGGVERGERDSLERLHGALCGYVSVVRASGVTPSEATERVRALVTRPATPAGERAIPVQARDALVELSLLWCTKQYASAEAATRELSNSEGMARTGGGGPGAELQPAPREAPQHEPG